MVKHIDKDHLLLVEIIKRKELLLDIVLTNGLSSKETLELSQELDNLILVYQRSRYYGN